MKTHDSHVPGKRSDSRPVVAIVGRPNVGKSTLFNRLVGQRRAIVHDLPGVTRDRIFATAVIQDRKIWLIDTGGLNDRQGEFQEAVTRQVMMAIDVADILLLVLDGMKGVNPSDQEIVDKLRPFGKKTIAIVNKMDPGSKRPEATEYHSLGLTPLLEVSAEHNAGIDALQQQISKLLPKPSVQPEYETSTEEPLRLPFLEDPMSENLP